MKHLQEYLVKESAKEITVMPDQEGPIDEINLSVDDKDISKDTIKKLEKYFPSPDLEVHLYNDTNWDDTLEELISKYTKDEVEEIKDPNSTSISVYKYNGNYFAWTEDDHGTQAIILSCDLKL